VYKKYRDGEIFQKLSVLRKSVLDKNYRISKDLFTGAISLTLASPRSDRSHSNFFK